MGLDIYIVERGTDNIDEAIEGYRVGGYSFFAEYREELAKQFGITLKEMEGFGGTNYWYKRIPFRELLAHSDCDGRLTHDELVELLKDFNTYKDIHFYKPDFNKLHEELKRLISISCANRYEIIFS